METRRILVELHARAGELAGESLASLDLPPGATCADLKDALVRRHPGLAELVTCSAVASGSEYLRDPVTLGEGDRYHLIPPVSGG